MEIANSVFGHILKSKESRIKEVIVLALEYKMAQGLRALALVSPGSGCVDLRVVTYVFKFQFLHYKLSIIKLVST